MNSARNAIIEPCINLGFQRRRIAVLAASPKPRSTPVSEIPSNTRGKPRSVNDRTWH
jgi:hypothetical protein